MSAENPDTAADAPPFLPMEARSVDALPDEPGWQFEPKWDGFRCLVCDDGKSIRLFAKSGKALHRFFPEVVEHFRSLVANDFVLDGELVIEMDGNLSFDALQMRLHPAESRIRKLAAEIPATFVAFDLPVAPGGRSLLQRPLTERRAELEALLTHAPAGILLSSFTADREEAQQMLSHSGGAVDGVIAKRLDGLYLPGERAMLKVKRIRSADCVVGGFRYGTGSDQVGSLLLGLFNEEGQLDHVGFTSTLPRDERPALTRRLEALRGGPGFTGKAPGGPSRWSTERTSTYVALRHELVVEVAYDHVSSDRFRHGTTLLRWRPDKAPAQCTFDQIEPAAQPADFLKAMIGRR